MFGSMSGRFKPYANKLAIIITAIALMIFAWTNLFININIDANAATLEGIGNQLEGKVQKDIGTKGRAIGDIADDTQLEAKSAVQQAKGKVKEGIGTTQNKLDDAKDTVEDKSESLVDSVKDFFD
ncbi:MAG: CsbD family protein [Pleurocapsa sp.]